MADQARKMTVGFNLLVFLLVFKTTEKLLMGCFRVKYTPGQRGTFLRIAPV